MPVVTRSQSRRILERAAAERIDGHFPAFRKLPAEIRHMVWEFAAGEPRVLDVTELPLLPNEFPRVSGIYIISENPSILSVCYEARWVGLRAYTPLFKYSTGQRYIYAYFKSSQELYIYRVQRFWEGNGCF
ncbi:hypothetical protein ACMFMG_012198 [Clarireedia jacksonii]